MFEQIESHPDNKRRHSKVLSVESLRGMFSYDAHTGEVVRLVSRGNRAAGSLVGTKNTYGHLGVEIGGKHYAVHRIAWAMHYGEWPELDVDHINGDPSDNRILNLRQATVSDNLRNSRPYARKHNLPRGVYENHGKFAARITITPGGKPAYLGQFDTIKDAEAAYRKAAKKNFGEFVREAVQ